MRLRTYVANKLAIVRRHRLAQGLRQVDLAQKSGVAIATLRCFESSGQMGLRGLRPEIFPPAPQSVDFPGRRERVARHSVCPRLTPANRSLVIGGRALGAPTPCPLGTTPRHRWLQSADHAGPGRRRSWRVQQSPTSENYPRSASVGGSKRRRRFIQLSSVPGALPMCPRMKLVSFSPLSPDARPSFSCRAIWTVPSTVRCSDKPYDRKVIPVAIADLFADVWSALVRW